MEKQEPKTGQQEQSGKFRKFQEFQSSLDLGEVLRVRRSLTSIEKELFVGRLTCPDCHKIDPSGRTDCPRHKK